MSDIIQKGKDLYILKELMKNDFACWNSTTLETIDRIWEMERKGLVEFITIKNIFVRARISRKGLRYLKDNIPEEILIRG